MPANEKEASLRALVSQKQNAVPELALQKREVMASVSTLANNPDNFDSLEAFEESNGLAPTEVSRYFRNRSSLEDQVRNELATARRTKRESSALTADAELDSASGQIKQVAASVLSGSTRMVGHAVGAVPTVAGVFNQFQVPEKATALHNRNKQYTQQVSALDKRRDDLEFGLAAGTVSNKEAQLEQVMMDYDRGQLVPLNDDENAYLDRTDIGAGSSRRQLLSNADDYFGAAETVSKAFTESPIHDLVNPLNREELSDNIATSYGANKQYFDNAGTALAQGDYGTAALEGFTGLGKLIAAGAGDIANNPAATFEFIAENAPQLAIGGISKTLLGATNLAYGVDIYTQSITDFKDNNDGALPSNDEAAVMLGFSLGASALEHAVDVSIIKQYKGLGSEAVSKTIDRVSDSIIGNVTNNVVTRSASAVAKGAVNEGITEAAQTAIEENLSKLNTDFDGKTIYEAGVIGAAVGGALSGAGRIPRETVRSIEGKAKTANEQLESSNKNRVIMDEATQSGDVAPLLDESRATFAPKLAIGALARRAADTNLTDKERTASQDQLNQVYDQQSNKVDTLLDEITTELDKPTEDLSALQRRAQNKKIKVLNTELEQASDFLTLVSAHRDVGNTLDRSSAEDITTTLQQAQSEAASPERQAAAQQTITLMMRDPDAITGIIDNDALLALSDSPDITPEQKAFVLTFTEAQAAVNRLQTAEDVTQQVLTGRDGFKGISQYVASIAHQLRNKNKAGAETELSALTKFRDDHVQRQKAFDTAKAEATKRGETVYGIRDPSSDNGWRLTTESPPNFNALRSRNGAIFYNPRAKNNGPTNRIIDGLAVENAALIASSDQLRAAIDLTFAAKVETAPVPDSNTVLDDQGNEVTVTTERPTTNTEEVSSKLVVDEKLTTPPVTADATPDVVVAPEVETSPTSEPEVTNNEAEAVGVTEELKAEVESGDTTDNTNALQQEVNEDEVQSKLGVNGQLDNFSDAESDLLASNFTQNSGNDQDKTKSPLADTKDYLSVLNTGGEFQQSALDPYLDDREFTDEQFDKFGATLTNFIAFAREMFNTINESLDRKVINPEFQHRDYTTFLNKNNEQNVRTAISVAAYTWLAENGRDLYNTNDDIRAILALGSDAHVSPEAINLLKYAGARQNLVIQAVGKRAAEALGLKAKKDVAGVNEQAQLELALGSHSLNVLIQQGYVERQIITDPLLKRGEAAEKDIGQPFIRVARQNDPAEAHEKVTAIVEASNGSANGLNKLFSVESSLVSPTTSPEEFTQETTTRTQNDVPGVLAKILNKAAKYKWHIREDMQQVRDAFSSDSIVSMAGGLDGTDAYTHKLLREPQDSKHKDILRDIERFDEFEGNLTEDTFYFLPRVWSPQRVGFAQNMVNPQTSKYQRHNITMGAWRSEVNPSNDSETHTFFKLAVLQGLGFDVDKELNSKSLSDFDNLLHDQTITDALQVLGKIVDGVDITADEQALVVEAVGTAGENFHSLDALVNLEQYYRALEEKTTFSTDIMFEVDGVTNGPALAHVLLGAIDRAVNPEFAAMFGLYPENSYKHYTEYKSQTGNLDLYEYVAAAVMKSMTDNTSPDRLKALSHFTGDLGTPDKITSKGRKLVKQPLTSMVFGAGIDNAIDNMAEAFVESIYQRLQDDANSDIEDFAIDDVLATVDQINNLLPNNLRVVTPKTLDDAMKITFTHQQTAALKKQFTNIVGTPVSAALNDKFADFLETRKSLNQGAQALWARSKVVFEHLYREKLDTKMDAGEITFSTKKDGTRIPYRDLSRTELLEIADQMKGMAPVVQTALSVLDKNKNAGINVAKQARRIVATDDTNSSKAYSQEIHFGKGFKTAEGKEQKTLSPRATKVESENPGVRAVIMLVHALDSAIASHSYGAVESLNIHDALGLGLNQITQGAQALNENTFKFLSEYSLPLEIHKALEASFTAEADIVEGKPELKAKLDKATVGPTTEFQIPVDAVLSAQLAVAAQAAEVKKYDLLADINVVDQYALEGGSYQVTAEQSEAMVQKLAQAKSNLKSARATLAKAIADSKRNVPTPKTVKPNTTAQIKSVAENTPWGEVSIPTVPSQQVPVQYLEANPNGTTKELIQWIAKQVNTGQPNFSLELLRQLYRTVDPKTKVRYITPDTQGPAPEGITKARGWYHLDNNGATINIKSPEFKHSGVTSELLLHELTHAAVAQTIAKPKTPEAKAAIAELERLRTTVAEHLARKNDDTYQAATDSVQELVAWGMTNKAFQKVLSEINVPSATGTRVNQSGLKLFIEKLVDIVFGKGKPRNEQYQNGLGNLIANTGLLMEAAQQDTKRNTENITLAMRDPDPRAFTTDEIYQALGKTGNSRVTDTQFSSHLRQTLQQVVDAGYGTAGALRAAAERKAPATADDVFLTALAEKRNPFVSNLTTLLRMSDQEAFVAESVEITVREALESRDKSTINQVELRTLFNQARKDIKPTDLPVGAYDLIFTVTKNAEGGSDFLSQFVAASMAYQPLHDKLSELVSPTDTDSLKGKSFLDVIKLLFTRLKNVLVRQYTNTREGQPLDAAIKQHAINLARVEAKKKTALHSRLDRPDTLIEQTGKSASDAIRRGAENLANAKVFSESKSNTVKLISGVASTIAGERAGQVMEGLHKLHNKRHKGRLSLAAEVVNEALNARDNIEWANDLLNKASKHQQDVKSAMININTLVNDAFSGDPLVSEQLDALKRILLDTDMATLLDNFDLTQIEELVSDPNKVKQEIKVLEQQLTSQHRGAYLARSKALAYFMVTGEVKHPNLVLNAHNIANMANTQHLGTVSSANALAATQTLDPLISLYALQYANKGQMALVRELMRTEANSDTADNGIEFILALHKGMKTDAMNVNFRGDATQMIKGYTKEIFNPYIDARQATEVVGKDLEKAGYKKVSNVLPQDPTDPDRTPKFLYVINDGGISETVSSFMQKSDKKLRGTAIHSGTQLPTGAVNLRNMAKARAVTFSKLATVPNYAETWNPASDKKSKFMVPVLNPSMTAVNYRYMMEEITKDNVLKQTNHVDKVLGAMVGSTLNKEATPGLNEQGVDAIRQQYNDDYFTNQDAYIEFSEQSKDPVVREQFRLLPQDTKAYIRKTWGRNGMLVRNDIYNTAFGYHKFTLREAFQKSPEHQNLMEKLLVGVLGQVEITDQFGNTSFMGSNKALKLIQSEHVWQEMVKVVKDIWVIKSLITLLGNESSNATLLFLAGVPLKDIIVNKVIATKAVFDYRRDARSLEELQTKLDIGYIKGIAARKAQQEVIQLEDALKKNVVRELVDAGMFQTLVEDIGQEEDPYSYQSKLDRWIDKTTAKVPKPIKQAAQIALVTHDTTLYKVLNRATTFSDFTSRYALHQHLTTRRNNPLSRTDSMKQIRAAFVNYDVPTHKGVQYLNDTGLVWFTKYYLRIQAVIIFLVKDNPVRALALLGMNHIVGPFSDILDSSMVQKSPLNLGAGAFELFDATGELITAKAADSLL